MADDKDRKFELKLAKKTKSKNKDYYLMQQYKNWRNDLKDKDFNTPFFILYKDFEVHLKEISPGALKLYLFYGFHAKNETGILWYGVEKISEYFGVSERTINNWNSELEDRGLITRVQNERGRNKITYLLPFSLNLIKLNELIEENEEFKSVYGVQDRAFHLFQWRKSTKDGENYDNPYHTLILIYKKDFDIGNYTHFTAFELPISDKFSNLVTDDTILNDDISLFESNISLDNIEVDIDGFAIKSKFNLKIKAILYNLLKELLDTETDLSNYRTVKLINSNESEEDNDEM